MCEWARCESIDIQETSIAQLPTSQTIWPVLKRFNMRNCRFTALPEQIGDWTQLVELNMAENPQIAALPASLGRLVLLEQLTVSAGTLTTFPSEIQSLTALRMLDASSNQLTAYSLPPEVGLLKNLQRLYMNRNATGAVLECFLELSALVDLDLSNNSIGMVPTDIRRLSQLRRLLFNENTIESLPDTLCELTHLEVLEVRHNQLKALPEEIGRLSAMLRLDLSNNRLVTLPPSLCRMTALQTLSLTNNELSAQLLDAVNAGMDAVMLHLRRAARAT